MFLDSLSPSPPPPIILVRLLLCCASLASSLSPNRLAALSPHVPLTPPRHLLHPTKSLITRLLLLLLLPQVAELSLEASRPPSPMPVPDTEPPALSLMGSDSLELEVFVDAYVEVSGVPYPSTGKENAAKAAEGLLCAYLPLGGIPAHHHLLNPRLLPHVHLPSSSAAPPP